MSEMFTIILADGTTYTWPRRYERVRPRGVGLEATQDAREQRPVQDAAGRWWACWAPDGPPRYWQDGCEISRAAFEEACRAD